MAQKKMTQKKTSNKTPITLDPTKKAVLHIGCGKARKPQMHPVFHGDGWQEVSLDIDATMQPDIVADMCSMGVVRSASMDAIYSAYSLNHVFAHEVPQVLTEWMRVLKEGGFAIIGVPDAQALALAIGEGNLEDSIYESAGGAVTPLELLYGRHQPLRQGRTATMAHKTIFTAQTLAKRMLGVGFHNIRVTRDAANYCLWAQGFKPGESLRDSQHKADIRGNYSRVVVKVPSLDERPDDLDAEPKKPWQPLGLKS